MIKCFRDVYFLLASFLVLVSTLVNAESKIESGAAQINEYLPVLQGKRVALVVNQSSQVNGKHLVDVLLAHNINVLTIFAPEHGFRGDHDAGANVKSDVDVNTGIKIVSIYGKNKKPSVEVMAQHDVVIFDIQDVGVRFYTYISSLHYVMESAADAGTAVLVLDRPNPNIQYVDGPILEEEFKSFVGMHPIPVLHGMTVGELAKMINGEQWLNSKKKLSLSVIPVKHYTRHSSYVLPIKPSPNLPNDQAIMLYPSLCLFEATPVSIGRGTDFPFQVIGYDEVTIGTYKFTPRSIIGAAINPKKKGILLTGQDLRQDTTRGFDLTYFIQWHNAFKYAGKSFFKFPDFMDKLSGTNKLRFAIEQGKSVEQIRQSWQPELKSFKQRRAPYLIYSN